jgi:hypothetical protein
LITAVSIIGCGASNAGSAARIAGTSVTESELANALSDLTQQVTATQLEISEAELTIEVLNRLVVRELVRKLGAEAGITVTESEIAAERSRVIAEFGSEQALVEAGLQQAIAPSLLDSVFEISLYVTRIGQKLEPNGDQSAQQSAFESFLFAYVDSALIEVSPKYGQWNPASASVVAASNPLVLTPQE